MKQFLIKNRIKIIDIGFVVFIALLFLYWVLRITADMNSILAGPDEAMRYIIPNFIFENGYLPTGYETEIHGNWSYAFYPQLLGAIISAGFMHVVSIFTQDPEWLVRAARLTSVLFGIIAAIFVRRSARLLFERNKHKVLISNMALILFALLPQITFLSSYVNNDIIALAGVSIIVYSCLYVYKNGLSSASTIWFAVGAIFAVLGYLNSYGFVLIGFIYLFTRVIQQYKAVKNKRNLWKYLLIIAGMPMLICLPFFIRNMVLYDGDIFGLNTFRSEYLEWVADTGIVLQNPYHEGLVHLLFETRWLIETVRNFVFGYFGGWGKGVMDVQFLPYYTIAAIGFLGFVGCLRKISFNKSKVFVLGLIILACLITIVLTLYYTLKIDYQPQGRYIIYLAIPVILAITMGLVYLVQKIVKTLYVKNALILITVFYIVMHLTVVYKTLY